MKPSVSVVMPVYNTARYVGEAIESILAQTFDDFEFLIVDDGSTDDSLAVIDRYARDDSRMQVVSRPNTGYVVALNEMLDRARGEFVVRMDSDDISAAGRIERQVAFLRDHPDIAVAGSAMEWIDPDGAPLRLHFPPESHDDIEAEHIRTRLGAIAHSSAIMRTDLVRRLGGYDPSMFGAEDLDLWLRIAEHARLINLQDVLIKYRWHFGSVSHVHNQRQVASGDRAVRNAMARRGGETSPTPAIVTSKSSGTNLATTYCTWAWWALAAGNHGTARKYALRTLLRRPMSPSTWRLLACVARGH